MYEYTRWEQFGCLRSGCWQRGRCVCILCILDVHIEMRWRQGRYVCVYTKRYMQIYVHVYVCHTFSMTYLDMTYIRIYVYTIEMCRRRGRYVYAYTNMYIRTFHAYVSHTCRMTFLDMTYIRIYV